MVFKKIRLLEHTQKTTYLVYALLLELKSENLIIFADTLPFLGPFIPRGH